MMWSNPKRIGTTSFIFIVFVKGNISLFKKQIKSPIIYKWVCLQIDDLLF